MNNIKIKLKILMVVAILGVVVIASSIFSGISMRSIEGGYSGLIGHEEKAQIASARGGRDLYIVIASSYGLAFETTDEGNARMLKVTLDAEKTYLDRLETLKGLMPSYSQRIDEIATEARAGFSQCEAPIKQAAASTDAASILEAGKLLKGKCEAVLMPVFSKQRALTDAIEAEAGKTVGSLSDQTVTTIVTTEVAVGVGLILAVLLALWIAGPKIVTPLTRLVEVMKSLADNDLSVEIPECDRADEVGVMARTVEVFKENAIERRKMEEREKAEQAHREARAKAVESLTTNFDQSVANVLDTVSGASTELEATAASMASGAEQTTRQAATVASATEEASNAVQTVASAAEELSASIREIGRQVTEASNVASSASEDANRTNQTVFELAETASKIGAVVNLITDIASQTNLLALNATIEAARAGDAGKGFAVVANEVKHLANQTGKATEEISGQITAIQAQTQKVVEAIGFIVKRIEEISHISTAIASAVEEQSAATSEIAGNVQQAAQGTNLVSASIGGVSDAASMTGAASQQVLTSARSLSGEAEHLKSIVTTFLREVRAA